MRIMKRWKPKLLRKTRRNKNWLLTRHKFVQWSFTRRSIYFTRMVFPVWGTSGDNGDFQAEQTGDPFHHSGLYLRFYRTSCHAHVCHFLRRTDRCEFAIFTVAIAIAITTAIATVLTLTWFFSPSGKSVIFCALFTYHLAKRLSNIMFWASHTFSSKRHRKMISGYLGTRKWQNFIGSKVFAYISIN